MRRLLAISVAVMLAPAIALAQTAPGSSGTAPGQKPGAAKNSAPGQKMLKEPGKPGGQGGASKYAPGQLPKTPPKSK
jgi:hypothetical protein